MQMMADESLGCTVRYIRNVSSATVSVNSNSWVKLNHTNGSDPYFESLTCKAVIITSAHNCVHVTNYEAVMPSEEEGVNVLQFVLGTSITKTERTSRLEREENLGQIESS